VNGECRTPAPIRCLALAAASRIKGEAKRRKPGNSEGGVRYFGSKPELCRRDPVARPKCHPGTGWGGPRLVCKVKCAGTISLEEAGPLVVMYHAPAKSERVNPWMGGSGPRGGP